MKKMLTALLTLSVLYVAATALAAAPPQAALMTDSRLGDPVGHDRLFTESAWQTLALPAEVMMALGDPRFMTLTAQDLPANVAVGLRPARTSGLIGLSVSRVDRRIAVNQIGRLTLTNSQTGYSYAVQALVTGEERPEK